MKKIFLATKKLKKLKLYPQNFHCDVLYPLYSGEIECSFSKYINIARALVNFIYQVLG